MADIARERKITSTIAEVEALTTLIRILTAQVEDLETRLKRIEAAIDANRPRERMGRMVRGA
jgi:hypothetical protein